MKFLFILVIILVLFSGCTQPSQPSSPKNITQPVTSPTKYEAPTFSPIRESHITVVTVSSPTSTPQIMDTIVGKWKITNVTGNPVITFLPEGNGVAVAESIFGKYEYSFGWNRDGPDGIGNQTYKIYTVDYGTVDLKFNITEDKATSDLFGNERFMIRM